MTCLIGIYGASGMGREVLPTIREQFSGQDTTLVFIDDGARETAVNGYPVVNWEGFLNLPASSRAVSVAIADAAIRERLAGRCHDAGVPMLDVRAASVVIYDEVTTAPGLLLQPFVTITSNVVIGRCFHANIYSYVAHDCVIGDFVTFAPGVKCNGNVHIEDHAYIGTGAILRQGTDTVPLQLTGGELSQLDTIYDIKRRVDARGAKEGGRGAQRASLGASPRPSPHLSSPCSPCRAPRTP